MLKNVLTVGASLDCSETGPVRGGEKRGRLCLAFAFEPEVVHSAVI